MNDLTTMLRAQAQAGLQARLNAAVEAGDQAAAKQVSDEMAALAVQTAPRPVASYSQEDIRAAMETKAPWFGSDPKRSAKALEFGKTLDLKKFATADAYAEALIKAVDEEFKPAAAAPPPPKKADEGEDDEDENGNADDDEDENDNDEQRQPPARAARRSDGPGEGDGAARGRRQYSGPWNKLSDAPRDVQTEINRAADKFTREPERRKQFIKLALESHHRMYQQKQQSARK